MQSAAVDRALGGPQDAVGTNLLALAEDQWFDRKSIRVKPEDLARHEVGLANAEGGVLVVGLAEGTVEGVDAEPDRVNELRQAAIDLTEPTVRAVSRLVPCRTADGRPDHLLIIDVESSEVVHATRADQCYLRVGDETRRLSFAQRQELLYDKSQAQWDARSAAVDRQELDVGLLAHWADAIGSRDHDRALAARGLLTRRGEVTNAALLLFGRAPQLEHPEAFVRVLRYRGVERGSGRRQRLADDVRCDGPVPQLLDDAIQVVQDLVPTRTVLGAEGRFVRESLVPDAAWVEGLVNAVVHRSYSLGGDHIRIEVFDDRIEIHSPGRFPGLACLDDPRHIARFSRNPRIARVCFDLRFGLQLGEGIRRMFEEMRIAGLVDPLYVQTDHSVRLVLAATSMNVDLASMLPALSREIVELIRAAGALGTGDIVESLALSRPAVLRRLTQLSEAGVIERVGKSPKDPRAFWRLRVDR